jgi:hypothetical protein
MEDKRAEINKLVEHRIPRGWGSDLQLYAMVNAQIRS